MTKYINANMLMQDIEQSRTNNNHNNTIAFQTHNAEHRHFIKMVLDQPTADVAPVVHGEWIHSSRGFDVGGDYECSLCHSPSGIKHFYNGEKYAYCPDCGTRMDGGK